MNASELKATAILGTIFALRMLGLFMIIPVFSIYGREYTSATPMLIGLAVGIYGLAQALLQIPVSMLAEKFSRKKIIIAGLLLFALGGAISAMATDIWFVILGRLLAGSGAISAVIMALLADVTREQSRSKAMAVMGMLIGASIFSAFVIGPLLVAKVGISGLFWLTSIAGIVAIGLIGLVPNPTRSKQYIQQVVDKNQETHVVKSSPINTFKRLLQQTLAVPNVKRLYWSVFTLHLLMTSIFVLLPIEFEKMGLPVAKHALVYLPLLLVGFVLAIPLIIIAEKNKKMRQVFVASMALIALGMAFVLAVFWSMQQPNIYLIGFGLTLFFIGFNLLEALIPSWLSKQAPIQVKNTVMGVSSSSQFFGAFLGGTLGGLLLTQPSATAWFICAAIALLGLVVIYGVGSPPYLSSLTVSLLDANVTDVDAWQNKIINITGVEDMIILAEDGIAYIKVAKEKFTVQTKQELENLIQQTLDK